MANYNDALTIRLNLENAALVNGLKTVQAELGQFANQTKTLSNEINALSNQMAVAAGAVTLGMGGMLKTAGDFEQWNVAFEVMIGNADRAAAFMNELVDFAKKTPFNTTELVEYSKRLMAMGIETEKVIPTMDMLGNIAAGVGREKLPQLILALGQVSAVGHLTGMELRQFTEAGVPLLAELGKEFGKTTGEVQKMVSAHQVSFKDVEAALASLTGEGGRFYNLMARQSETFLGTISNIQDALTQIFAKMGEAIMPVAKQITTGLKEMAERLNDMDPASLAAMAQVFATFSGILISLFVTTKITSYIIGFTSAITGMVNIIVKIATSAAAAENALATMGLATKAASSAAQTMSGISIAARLGIWAVAIGAVATAAYLLYQKFKQVNEEAAIEEQRLKSRAALYNEASAYNAIALKNELYGLRSQHTKLLIESEEFERKRLSITAQYLGRGNKQSYENELKDKKERLKILEDKINEIDGFYQQTLRLNNAAAEKERFSESLNSAESAKIKIAALKDEIAKKTTELKNFKYVESSVLEDGSKKAYDLQQQDKINYIKSLEEKLKVAESTYSSLSEKEKQAFENSKKQNKETLKKIEEEWESFRVKESASRDVSVEEEIAYWEKSIKLAGKNVDLRESLQLNLYEAIKKLREKGDRENEESLKKSLDRETYYTLAIQSKSEAAYRDRIDQIKNEMNEEEAAGTLTVARKKIYLDEIDSLEKGAFDAGIKRRDDELLATEKNLETERKEYERHINEMYKLGQDGGTNVAEIFSKSLSGALVDKDTGVMRDFPNQLSQAIGLDKVGQDLGANLSKEMTSILGGVGAFVSGAAGSVIAMGISSILQGLFGSSKTKTVAEYAEEAFKAMVKKTNDALEDIGREKTKTEKQLDILDELQSLYGKDSIVNDKYIQSLEISTGTTVANAIQQILDRRLQIEDKSTNVLKDELTLRSSQVDTGAYFKNQMSEIDRDKTSLSEYLQAAYNTAKKYGVDAAEGLGISGLEGKISSLVTIIDSKFSGNIMGKQINSLLDDLGVGKTNGAYNFNYREYEKTTEGRYIAAQKRAVELSEQLAAASQYTLESIEDRLRIENRIASYNEELTDAMQKEQDAIAKLTEEQKKNAEASINEKISLLNAMKDSKGIDAEVGIDAASVIGVSGNTSVYQALTDAIMSLIGMKDLGTASGLKDAIGLEGQIADLKAAMNTIRLESGLTPLAVGAINIPKTMPALLHPGEIVIPQKFADGLREGRITLSGPGNSMGGSPINQTVNVTIQSATKSGQQVFQEISPYLDSSVIKRNLGNYRGLSKG